MIGHFPRTFSNKAIALYFGLLLLVTLLFISHSLSWYWMVFGAVEVCSFFYFSCTLPLEWSRLSDKAFEKLIFRVSLLIRLIYVVLSYYFYLGMTGAPFEFGAADVMFYDEMGRYGHTLLSKGILKIYPFMSDYAGGLEISDSGYPIYLSILYFLTNNSIIITRMIKALLSAYTCVLVYRLALRNFGGETARLAAIFCMLIPNLIYYCGLHLKETEMVFLCLLFVERADSALRDNRFLWKKWIVAFSAALFLFAFRTAIGLVAFLSLATAGILSSGRVVSRWQKAALLFILALGLFFSAGSQVFQETQSLVDSSGSQSSNMEWRSERTGGNSLAKYAGSAVFAPLIFTIPFPTLVDIEGQEDLQMIHGGNYVKNVLSFFVILSLILLLFSGDWKRHVLLVAFMCGYLVVLVFSNFAQSERFHLPALPFELMFASYAITHLRASHVKFFNYWLLVVFVANLGWAWFKLAGRGLV
ncbi:MAG: hypothetical protein MJZ16_02405 [Bacteroidales bacterium]|nr:hypothetical protein [Bacteroidales bacterium]